MAYGLSCSMACGIYPGNLNLRSINGAKPEKRDTELGGGWAHALTLQSILQSLPSCTVRSPGACRKCGRKKRSWMGSPSSALSRDLERGLQTKSQHTGVAHPRPLSLLQRGLAPRSKGKARAGLTPARRQARPGSALCPGLDAQSQHAGEKRGVAGTCQPVDQQLSAAC